MPTRLLIVFLAALAGACAPSYRAGPDGPDRTDPLRGTLPPIPEREGPLALDLVYPPEEAALAVRDSTFVFGSTGTGDARLWINEMPVTVAPNGAFLAFLPVPDDGEYRLLATADGDTARLAREVEVPEPPPVLARDSAVILEETIAPRGGWAVLPGERIEVAFRGTPGGRATLLLPDGSVVPLVEEHVAVGPGWGERAFGVETEALEADTAAGVSAYRGFFTAQTVVALDTTAAWPTLATVERPRVLDRRLAPDTVAPADSVRVEDPPPLPRRRARERARDRRRTDAPDTLAVSGGAVDTIVGEMGVAGEPRRLGAGGDPPVAVLRLVVDGDTARALLPLNLVLVDPDRPRVGVAVDAEPEDQPTNGTVIGRPGAGTAYHYFWPRGTELTLTGERNGEYRVRLASDLTAWVSTGEVRLLRPGTPPPTGIVGTVRLAPYSNAIDVRFATERRMPFHVDEGERSLAVTIYGGTSNTDWLQYGGIDPLVEWAEWSHPRDGVYRLTLHLDQAPWGYRAFWDRNGDLIVRVRRPPRIDAGDPLDGLLIAVDAGHPPAGTIGPTRLTEAEANLAIARRLAEMLRDAGARVLETRPDTAAVPLYARTNAAIEADADILVSVHNNAFPDGVNPFENAGTSVYYFHRHAVGLARAMQRELLEELRLRNLGIGRANLALVRPSWMPAVLTETMYLMIPRQEAALRDPATQRRIAEAHVEALRAFLRERSREQRDGERE